nr:eukaryotic translation initiation factor 2 gamma subunit [Tanacetum cinerariifolium]
MASSLVLKQLFASNLVTRSLCRPAVATSSRFLCTKSIIRAYENPSNGYHLLAAHLDLFYKFVKCDSDDKTSQGLEKGDRKAYLAMSLKGIDNEEKAKDVMKTETYDLLEDIKGLEYEFKSRYLSLQMKNGVLNLSLPKDCDSDNETYQDVREERGKKDVYMTLSLKAREHQEENNVMITKTYDLLDDVKDKEADFYQEKDGYITHLKD